MLFNTSTAAIFHLIFTFRPTCRVGRRWADWHSTIKSWLPCLRCMFCMIVWLQDLHESKSVHPIWWGNSNTSCWCVQVLKYRITFYHWYLSMPGLLFTFFGGCNSSISHGLDSKAWPTVKEVKLMSPRQGSAAGNWDQQGRQGLIKRWRSGDGERREHTEDYYRTRREWHALKCHWDKQLAEKPFKAESQHFNIIITVSLQFQ